MRSLCGLYKLNKGCVSIGPENITNSNNKVKLFFVPPYIETILFKSVSDVIYHYQDFYPKLDRDIIVKSLEEVNIGEEDQITDWSFAHRKYILNIIAIYSGATYIFTEDPFGGFDDELTASLKTAFVNAIVRQQCAIILSAHTLDVVGSILDKHYFIEKQRIYSSEGVEKLFTQHHKYEFTFDYKINRMDFVDFIPLYAEVEGNIAYIMFKEETDKLERMINQTKPILVEEKEIVYDDLFRMNPRGTV